ncbi:hypothetical protein [Propioniciclava flava]
MVVPPQAGVPREPRWHLAMAALGHDGEAEPTRRLLAALGPVETQSRLVGEPPVTSTRWRAGGVEVVLHDGVVVAVVLHLPQADLRTWAGVGNDATLGDLERAFAGRPGSRAWSPPTSRSRAATPASRSPRMAGRRGAISVP